MVVSGDDNRDYFSDVFCSTQTPLGDFGTLPLSPLFTPSMTEDIDIHTFNLGDLSPLSNSTQDSWQICEVFSERSTPAGVAAPVVLPRGLLTLSDPKSVPSLALSKSPGPFSNRPGDNLTSFSDGQAKYQESSTSATPLCVGLISGKSSCSLQMLSVLAQPQGDNTSIWDGPFDSSIMISSHVSSGAVTPPYKNTRNNVNHVIRLNRAILDVANSVLECQCSLSNDRLMYLLIFVAMDVMARYADVASPGPGDTAHWITEEAVEAGASHMVPGGGEQQWGTDAAMHATHVFGELHRVLHFIDTFAERFRRPRRQYQQLNSPPEECDGMATTATALNNASMGMEFVIDSPVTGRSQRMTEPINDGNDDEDNDRGDDSISGSTLEALEMDLRRSFEGLRHRIKTILQTTDSRFSPPVVFH